MLVVLVVSERRASACLIMLRAKQGSHRYFLTPLVRRVQVSNPRPPAPEVDALPFALSGHELAHE